MMAGYTEGWGRGKKTPTVPKFARSYPIICLLLFHYKNGGEKGRKWELEKRHGEGFLGGEKRVAGAVDDEEGRGSEGEESRLG
jgi:hypothetical protein